eukprot:CAMPEP_0194296480 /NCGR_PEP_ID=MMETSP0169-20130528/56228_1 /TAXON_ID=218684 /ORGANISM="Corethron pennatum, Strain L29A3" /LENGTH=74 /DNA_ID=CAMNT_0039045963 /DNA_START=24 /DNA_END=244 /DNA_ORIENTATION=+
MLVVSGVTNAGASVSADVVGLSVDNAVTSPISGKGVTLTEGGRVDLTTGLEVGTIFDLELNRFTPMLTAVTIKT